MKHTILFVVAAFGPLSLSGCTGHIFPADPQAAGSSASKGMDHPPSGSGGSGGQTAGSGGAGSRSDDTGLSCDDTRDVPSAPMRRLTRQEYSRSVQDLLGVAPPSPDSIPADETIGPFAVNLTTAVTELSVEEYLDTAETLAQTVVSKSSTLNQLVGCSRPATSDSDCASSFIDRFGKRAFRRPLRDDEKADYLALYNSYAGSGGFSEGIRLVVQTVLQSPSFLYHVEFADSSAPAGQVTALDSYQVAARLSFFLWTSVPDDTLMNEAASDHLSDPEIIEEQVTRMLADARASQAIASFHLQWLDLGKLDGLAKDTTLLPQYTGALRDAMRAETVAFADHVIRQDDGRLETLLTAPYSILDGPLFDLYGVSRPDGTSGPVKVQLDPAQRSGLLTQASFLATHAAPNQSSPVTRGVAVLRNLLCVDLPDPPPNVNITLPAPAPNATTRQRFTAHESVASCAGCHVSIDGIGMGFEHYDALGSYRTAEGGLPVDATGNIVGTDVPGPFDGAVALGQKLASSPQVQLCATKQWFRFALGRMETRSDDCSLKHAFDTFQASRHDVRALMSALATSDAFRYLRAQ
jgi:hypothetical protein